MLCRRYILKSVNICNPCCGILYFQHAFISENCWIYLLSNKSSEVQRGCILCCHFPQNVFSNWRCFHFHNYWCLPPTISFFLFNLFIDFLTRIFYFFKFLYISTCSLIISIFIWKTTDKQLEGSFNKNNTTNTAVEQKWQEQWSIKFIICNFNLILEFSFILYI